MITLHTQVRTYIFLHQGKGIEMVAKKNKKNRFIHDLSIRNKNKVISPLVIQKKVSGTEHYITRYHTIPETGVQL